MKKIWFDEAWEDYIYWQSQDKKCYDDYYKKLLEANDEYMKLRKI